MVVLRSLQGGLLLYGTYLAGLTSNVSLPPVNQSPTIMTAVSLVTLSTAVGVPVSRFLQAWPNVVYSMVAGAIFICTLATNCMLFVPQVRETVGTHHKKTDRAETPVIYDRPNSSDYMSVSHTSP